MTYPETRKRYLRHTHHFYTWCSQRDIKQDDITIEHALAWLMDCGEYQKQSHATLHQKRSALSAYTSLPIRDCPKIKNYLKSKDSKDTTTLPVQTKTKIRNDALCALHRDTGLDYQSLEGLKPQNIQVKEKTYTVTTRNHGSITCPMPKNHPMRKLVGIVSESDPSLFCRYTHNTTEALKLYRFSDILKSHYAPRRKTKSSHSINTYNSVQKRFLIALGGKANTITPDDFQAWLLNEYKNGKKISSCLLYAQGLKNFIKQHPDLINKKECYEALKATLQTIKEESQSCTS